MVNNSETNMRENGEVSSNVMNEYMEDKRIIHDRLPGSDYAFLEGRGTRVEVCRPKSTSVSKLTGHSTTADCMPCVQQAASGF